MRIALLHPLVTASPLTIDRLTFVFSRFGTVSRIHARSPTGPVDQESSRWNRDKAWVSRGNRPFSLRSHLRPHRTGSSPNGAAILLPEVFRGPILAFLE